MQGIQSTEINSALYADPRRPGRHGIILIWVNREHRKGGRDCTLNLAPNLEFNREHRKGISDCALNLTPHMVRFEVSNASSCISIMFWIWRTNHIEETIPIEHECGRDIDHENIHRHNFGRGIVHVTYIDYGRGQGIEHDNLYRMCLDLMNTYCGGSMSRVRVDVKRVT